MTKTRSEVEARMAMRMDRFVAARREYIAAVRKRQAAERKRDDAVARADSKLAAFDADVDAAIRGVVDAFGNSAGAASWLGLSEALVKRALAAAAPTQTSRPKPTPKPKVDAPQVDIMGQLTLDDLGAADDAREES